MQQLKMREIYLDNAATTPVRKEVMEAVLPYFSENYGNPSSFHYKGLKAKNALENARNKIANTLNCSPDEIIFTSGGTESINLAIKGIARANKNRGNHIITSKIEHPAVLETCKYLEKNGFRITYVNVGKDGIVSPAEIKKVITNKTILVSIMYANNEIGTVQPIKEIGEICKAEGIPFHTDACQAAEYLELDTKAMNVDLLTLNGSKIYGPKGIGILYLKRGINLEPLIHGGGQERGIRSGTENVPSIIGFAKALELAQEERTEESTKLIALRDKLIKGLLNILGSKLNGHQKQRLPNNANISFKGIEGESIILSLNEKGICASTGSACNSRSLEPSHVLMALGMSHEEAHGSVRFSLGKWTTNEDIEYVMKTMPDIVNKLREISPLKIKND